MKSLSMARLAAVLLLSLVAGACRGTDADVSTTTRPPPADQCEATALEVVDRLEDFLAGFSDLSPDEFLALDDPEGLDDFQEDVRQSVLEGVIAGCVEQSLTEALDVELERLSGQGPLADFLGEAIRSGGQAPAQDVLVSPGEDLVSIVASLGSGSVVTLAEGTYNLSMPMILDAGMTFVGAGSEKTIIRSSAPDAAVAVIGRGSLAMQDLTIEHTGTVPASLVVAFQGPIDFARVRLTGAAAGEDGAGGSGLVLAIGAFEDEPDLTAPDDSPERRRVDVSESEFVDNEFAGIAVSGEIAPVLRGNLLVENGACGICYFESAGGEARDNIMEGNAFGIQIADQASPRIENNRVIDNTAAGIVIDGSARPAVSGNVVEGGMGVGIQVQTAAAPTLRSNTIGAHPVAISFVDNGSGIASGNSITGAEVGVQIGGRAAPEFYGNIIHGSVVAGLAFGEDAEGTFTDNNITGNEGTGIVVASSGAPTLVGNTISRGAAGVLFTGSSGGRLEDNLIVGQEIGIDVGDDATPELVSNRILDTTAGGLIYGERAGGLARGNVILNPGAVGIQVAGFSQPELESNTVDARGTASSEDGERVGMLYGDSSAGSATGNQILEFTIGVQIGGSASPRLEANFIDGGDQEGVGILYGGESGGTSVENRTANHTFGFQVGDEAAPILEGNTVESASVAAFLMSGSATGSLERNSCPADLPGVVVAEDADPELGENDCTVLAG